MKFDRLIQLIRAELSREHDTKRIYELLSLLSLVKDERIQELEKKVSIHNLQKYKKVA